MKIGFKQIILTTALAGLAAPVALAQSTDNPFARGRYTAVTERQQSEFDPEPVHAGAFEIWSRLAASADYNNNIFAEPNNADDDTIIHVQPDIDVRSMWSSHELTAGLGIDHREYVSNQDESTTDYTAFVGGRVDVQRAFNLRGRIDLAHLTEPRYEPAGASSPDPVEYDRMAGQVGAAYRTDRFQLEGDVGQREDDFDGVNNFRDLTDSWVYGRASYAVSPDVAIFLQGRTSDLDYSAPTGGNPNRDGTRSSVQVGANFELQAPFSGEVAIGNVQDEKDDPSQRDIDGLSLDGRLYWYPTQLTTVTFRAHQGVFDPGIPDVTNAVDTNYGVRVDHELRRNILLFGEVSGGRYEFEGTTLAPYDREDDFVEARFGAGYKLNKNMRLDASYSMQTRNSSGAQADRDLDQNILSIGLTIYP
jgi:hypothetical protein